MTLGPVTLGHYLSLGAILFALSVIGIFLNRKNLIVLLMAIELGVYAVYPSRKHLTHKVRALIDFLVNAFRLRAWPA